MRSPARHMITIRPPRRRAVRSIPGGAHDGDDLFDLRRIGRVVQALVLWRVAGVESRQRRRRSTSTRTIEQQLGHDPSSGSLNELRLSAPLDTELRSLGPLAIAFGPEERLEPTRG